MDTREKKAGHLPHTARCRGEPGRSKAISGSAMQDCVVTGRFSLGPHMGTHQPRPVLDNVALLGKDACQHISSNLSGKAGDLSARRPVIEPEGEGLEPWDFVFNAETRLFTETSL